MCYSEYAENVVAIFVNQTKSEYYGGNIHVAIESIVLDHFSALQRPRLLYEPGNPSHHYVC